jgi:hypothetical protein
MRTCRHCFKEQEDEEFGVNNFMPDKRAIYCKECNRNKTRALRENCWKLLLTTKVKVSRSLLNI